MDAGGEGRHISPQEINAHINKYSTSVTIQLYSLLLVYHDAPLGGSAGRTRFKPSCF